MVHQPHGGASGTASDIAIQAREVLRLRTALQDIYAKHTGQTTAAIEDALDRDNFMAAPQAVQFGLIDEVVGNRADAETAPAP